MGNETRLLFIIVPLCICAGGLLFCWLGIASLRREHGFTRRAIRAEGIVVGFERRRTAGRRLNDVGLRYVYHPIISYTTREGHPAQFLSPVGTMPRIQREGQRMPILYNPANPADGRIATGCMQYGLPIFFIIFGLGMAIAAALIGVGVSVLLAQLPAS